MLLHPSKGPNLLFAHCSDPIPLLSRSAICRPQNLAAVLAPTSLTGERGHSGGLQPLEGSSIVRARLGSHGGDWESMRQRSGGGNPVYKSGSRRLAGPLLFYILAQPGQTGGPIADVLHWARSIEALIEFISPQSVMPQQVSMSVMVCARDLYLHTNKDWGGSKMSLDPTDHQQDAERGEALGSPVTVRIELSESRSPRPREDPKGKAPASFPDDQMKKRKLFKAIDAPPKKSTSSATSVAQLI